MDIKLEKKTGLHKKVLLNIYTFGKTPIRNMKTDRDSYR